MDHRLSQSGDRDERPWPRRIVDDARAWAQGRSPVAPAVFTAWFAWTLVNYLADPVWYWPIWNYLNLGIHELGHVVFRAFGETMAVAGGSLFQCLVPVLAGASFARRRDYTGIVVCAGWLSTNILNVSTYMGDAVAQQLPLVSPFGGGGDPIHDWNWLFSRFGGLLHCVGIARFVRLCGVVTMLGALGAGAWLCAVMARSERRAFDDE